MTGIHRMDYCRTIPILVVMIYTILTSALPSYTTRLALPPSNGVTWESSNISTINTSALTKELAVFPPGPPQRHYYYQIPNSDLILEFSTIRSVPDRDEILVKQIVLAAIHAAINKKGNLIIPAPGYRLQEGSFLLSVEHPARVRQLTWHMWVRVLQALMDYVKAYPTWDFGFEIRLVPEESFMGYVVGVGFAKTR